MRTTSKSLLTTINRLNSFKQRKLSKLHVLASVPSSVKKFEL